MQKCFSLLFFFRDEVQKCKHNGFTETLHNWNQITLTSVSHPTFIPDEILVLLISKMSYLWRLERNLLKLKLKPTILKRFFYHLHLKLSSWNPVIIPCQRKVKIMFPYSYTITSHHRCDLNFGFNKIGKIPAIELKQQTNWEPLVNYVKIERTNFLCWFYWIIKSLQLTLSGLQTNVMFLVDVSQNKQAGVANNMIWIDGWITVKTADYTNRSFVAVCCGTENQVIAPCAILFHASQVISPRWVSMDKVEQICSIGLWERKKFKVNWMD